MLRVASFCVTSNYPVVVVVLVLVLVPVQILALALGLWPFLTAA